MKTLSELKAELAVIISAMKSNTLSAGQVTRLDTIKADIEKAQKHEKAIAAGETLVKAMAQGDPDYRPSTDLDGNPITDANAGFGGIKGASSFRLGTSDGGTPFTLSKSVLGGASKAIASQVRGVGAGFGMKSILPAGSFDGPLTSDTIVPLGRDTASIVELLPTVLITGRHFHYMRQAERANNAAVVAPGGLKPTSTMGLEMVKKETQVVAHLSEPIDVFLLEDVGNMLTIVNNEMLYGLNAAVDRELLKGTGEGQLTGLLNTVGIQTQAYTADALTTIRTAITKARQAGHEPNAIVLGYADWQAIELLRENTNGAFLLNASSPVDVAAKKLWGLQVVESANMTAGTALILNTAAAGIVVSKPGVRLEWHVSGEGFETNTTRIRCETRVELAVTQPAAIVKATITGA